MNRLTQGEIHGNLELVALDSLRSLACFLLASVVLSVGQAQEPFPRISWGSGGGYVGFAEIDSAGFTGVYSSGHGPAEFQEAHRLGLRLIQGFFNPWGYAQFGRYEPDKNNAHPFYSYPHFDTLGASGSSVLRLNVDSRNVWMAEEEVDDEGYAVRGLKIPFAREMRIPDAGQSEQDFSPLRFRADFRMALDALGSLSGQDSVATLSVVFVRSDEESDLPDTVLAEDTVTLEQWLGRAPPETFGEFPLTFHLNRNPAAGRTIYYGGSQDRLDFRVSWHGKGTVLIDCVTVVDSLYAALESGETDSTMQVRVGGHYADALEREMATMENAVPLSPTMRSATGDFNTHLLGLMHGEADSVLFGWTVQCGDINADGYEDVGVYSQMNYATTDGRVSIFFGGAVFDTIPDVVLTGPPASGFGIGMVMDTDLSGDGINDLVLGVPQATHSLGQIHIYRGGNPFDPNPDWIINHPLDTPAFDFGGVMTTVDFNNDGESDLVTTTTKYVAGYKGMVIVYYGGPQLDTTPDLSFLTGNQADAVGARRFNDDGYGDLFVRSLDQETTYLYQGSPDPDSTLDATFPMDYPIGTGDFNGDGFTDLYTSIHGFFLGGADVDTIPDAIWSVGNLGMMGWAASGRLNVDPYDDLLLGRGYPLSEFSVWLGDLALDTIPALIVRGDWDFYLGYSVAVGDVNGDGVEDMVIGEPKWGTLPWVLKWAGRVAVLSGDTTGLAVSHGGAAGLLPTEYHLGAPYPNPFNARVTIPYTLGSPMEVAVEIYDLAGRRIHAVPRERQAPGLHELVWEAVAAPSGVYVARLTTPFGQASRKLLLLK